MCNLVVEWVTASSSLHVNASLGTQSTFTLVLLVKLALERKCVHFWKEENYM